MKKITEIELTPGSHYKVYSLGSREQHLTSEGVFEGYITVGVDEIGLLINLNEHNGEMSGKYRIVPIHAVLAIDILEAKPNDKEDDSNEISHYVG
jgi:hypothetical protein